MVLLLPSSSSSSFLLLVLLSAALPFASMATASASSSADLRATFRRIRPRPDPVHGVPLARSSHGVSVVLDENGREGVLVYGGEHVARTPIEDDGPRRPRSSWIARRENDDDSDGEWRWSAVPSAVAPPPRVGHAQAVANGRFVYAFGGRTGVNEFETALNDLWRLDARTMEWTDLSEPAPGSAPPPCPRSFHALVAVGSNNGSSNDDGSNDGNDFRLYVFGGCGAEGRLADLHEYDAAARKWTNHGACPGLRGRGGASLLVLDGGRRLAVVGGFRGEESGEVAFFDVVAERWCGPSTNANNDGNDDRNDRVVRPRSVCVHASLVEGDLAGSGLIFGGEVDPSEKGHDGAGGFANDLLLLTRDDENDDGVRVETVVRPDDDDGEWPESRGWSHGDARKNRLWFFGGLTGDDEKPQRLDDLWVCDVVRGDANDKDEL